MNWKTKALIQSAVARLPDRISYPMYYQLQRRFGALRSGRIDPTSRLQFGIDFCKKIGELSRSPKGATFFEVGTGWRLNVPLACWLCGAERVITVDLNRYLKPELIAEDLEFIRQNQTQLAGRFRGQVASFFDETRWQRLVRYQSSNTHEFCEMIGVEYHAPGDAADTTVPNGTIDYHISCNVLEHIPSEVLSRIFAEATRILRPEGLLVHRVDHSDHFSHTDSSLSAIHFLRYSDAQWRRLADNRYGYVNRLREEDYLAIFAESGHRAAFVESETDHRVRRHLAEGFPLNKRFQKHDPDGLAHTASLFVLEPVAAPNETVKVA